MPRDVRFWRNLALIGMAHIVLIGGLIRWSHETKPVPAQSVVWLNGGAGDGAAGPVEPPALPPKTASLTTPEPEPETVPTAPPEEENRPVVTSAPSEIQLPTPEPSATATPPKPTPSPVAKASPKSTPKPTPKTTPTPKSKSKPKLKQAPKKLMMAKATPKPSPKMKPTPAESDANKERSHAEAEKQIAKTELEKGSATEKESTPKKAVTAQGGNGKGTSPGAGGHAGGSGGESQFGWYGSMLHDRFYSEWVQPTTSLASGSKASALVKIRIEKDGSVSSFEIIKASGNSVIDDSITAVAKRVTQVDPLPAGLGNGEHYDVKINFELSADQ
jgi:TonB family protein